MKEVIAKVVQVMGNCNAHYRLGDKVVVNLKNACVDKDQSGSLCIFALSAILSNMVRIKQGKKILASCPDPATGLGGNVIFEITKKESTY
jgi:uncharacterized repeat protein (TIGR04076 family)